jgi:light-regulated signal transduction histidine kinase (bacteriophytochrome)
MQPQTRNTAKMIESEKAMHQACHDIRNKLNLVTGYATLLAEDPGLNRDQQAMAARITATAFDISKELDRLLELALARSLD